MASRNEEVTSPREPDRRDPERSRRAILDAAESLFAARGFNGASLEEIGQVAGVSRGTPGYFFGSKEDLYRAVLDRAIAARREVMDGIVADALDADQAPDETIIAFVVAYLDFLAGDSHFLRLVDRESLAVNPQVYDAEVQLDNLEQAIERLGAQLDRGGYGHDPRQLFISALALSEWPFVHGPLIRGLGFDLADPGFIAARKSHITAVIRAWLGGPPESESAS